MNYFDSCIVLSLFYEFEHCRIVRNFLPANNFYFGIFYVVVGAPAAPLFLSLLDNCTATALLYTQSSHHVQKALRRTVDRERLNRNVLFPQENSLSHQIFNPQSTDAPLFTTLSQDTNQIGSLRFFKTLFTPLLFFFS